MHTSEDPGVQADGGCSLGLIHASEAGERGLHCQPRSMKIPPGRMRRAGAREAGARATLKEQVQKKSSSQKATDVRAYKEHVRLPVALRVNLSSLLLPAGPGTSLPCLLRGDT